MEVVCVIITVVGIVVDEKNSSSVRHDGAFAGPMLLRISYQLAADPYATTFLGEGKASKREIPSSVR